MAAWREVAAAAPELAEAVCAYLDAHVHKTLATLRKDGSPRISGIEASFADGELWFGGLWRSQKALDLQRDPRFALHSASVDPPEWTGDAKVAGRAEEITDPARIEAVLAAVGGGAPPGRVHLFRADVAEIAIVRVGEPADHLVIKSWHEGPGVKRMTRR